MKAYLGIDIAKDKYDVCLVYDAEKWGGQFANSPKGHRALVKWVSKKVGKREVHAALEATGRYGEEVAKYMYGRGYQVSVVNPSRIKNYGRSKLQRNKTDKIDATLIADFVATQKPHLWQPPSEAEETLNQLVQRLNSLIENQTQEKNRLKAGKLSPVVKQSIKEHLVYLAAEIKKVKKAIKDLIDQDPELKEKRDLLQSITGIGEKTAALLLAMLPTPERDLSSKQVAAYAGLTPAQLESGKYKRGKDVLSKLGHRRLRAALYLPALNAMRFNPIVVALANRLRKRGKHKMSVVAAAMRKLLVLAYGVLKSGVPFDPYYVNSTQPVAG